MRLRHERDAIPGVLFAEDFDDHEILDAAPDPAPVACEEPRLVEAEAPEVRHFTLADLQSREEEARREGYAEGLAAAQEAAFLARNEVLAAIQARLSDAEQAVTSLVASHLGELANTVLAVVASCLPVLCARLGSTDLLAALRTLVPRLMGEPELLITLHPDQEELVRQDLASVVGKETRFRIETSSSIGPADARLCWRGGNATRDTRALRRQIFLLVRDALGAGGEAQHVR